LIEAGMYFALGLATAGLLALMIAPLFWRRAVRLTRARIEHSVPRSLGEIQAEKDQLRAEFAMSTRRLEMSVERLREKASQHLAEINDKRDLIRRLSEEQKKRVDAVEQLEQRERELDKLLRRREDRLADATAELEALRTNLADRGRALEQLEQSVKRSNSASEQKTVELVARGTEIENLRDQLAAAKARHTALHIERTRLETELAETHSNQSVDAQRIESLERQVARLDAARHNHLTELQGRDEEIERLHAELTARSGTVDGLEQRLAETEGAYAEMAAHASDLSLQLDENSRRDHADALSDALHDLGIEKDALFAEVAALQEAHDRLAAENAELRRMSGDEWEAERMENARLRERLNDIAGDVARLTRSYRGDMGMAELAALASGGEPDPPPREAGRGLSARIRARQRSAQG